MWQITGQKKAVELLRRSLDTGAVSHAYLFTGPAHSGKMTLALELARALNCTGPEIPCGECESCRKISEGKHADVQIIGLIYDENSSEKKLKTEISIDQIRQLQHMASLPPFEGKYRVFIIETAELLSVEASNSLLKTLEEPESRVVFMLLASDPGVLLETVVSRCQPVELAAVPYSEAEEALKRDWGIEPDRAALLARISRGRFGWAASAARDDNLLEHRTELLEAILDVVDSDCEDRFAYSTHLAERFGRDRAYVYERLDLWLDWWRDMLMIKTGSGDNITNIDRMDELKEMAAGRSLRQIRDFLWSIQSAGSQLRMNANSKLVLEGLMLDIPGENTNKETGVPGKG